MRSHHEVATFPVSRYRMTSLPGSPPAASLARLFRSAMGLQVPSLVKSTEPAGVEFYCFLPDMRKMVKRLVSPSGPTFAISAAVLAFM